MLVSAMNGGAPAAPTTLGGVANEDAKEAQKKEESDAQGVKRSVSPEEEVGRGKRVKRES